jgi:cardiolipin synthase
VWTDNFGGPLVRPLAEDESRAWRRTRCWIVALIALISLAGCGTMPNALEAIHSRHFYRQPPQFAGADGALPKGRNQVIISRLEQKTGDEDFLKRHLAFEQAITGTPAVVGNKVTLLKNGPDTYRAMFGAIEAATDSINLETYTFEDDPIGEKFAEALIAKQQAGVQVNIIFDNFGSLDTSNAFFDRMRSNGIRALRFNPLNPIKRRFHLFSANHRDHRKLMIVDGRIAFLGGINISNDYSSGPGKSGKKSDGGSEGWRDTDVEIEGPAVAECQQIFLGTWQEQGGRPLSPRNYYPPLQTSGQAIVRVIGSVPKESSLIYVTLISAIHNAESNVYITDAYFAPDSQMVDEMEAAARRGVDVRLLVPGTPDVPLVAHAARSYYDDLLDAGVRIYEWQGKMLHAKTATVDGVWSTVGSSNLDWWSIARNNEISATILSVRFGREMDAMFAADANHAEEIDPKQWKSRSIVERLEETLAWILKPML